MTREASNDPSTKKYIELVKDEVIKEIIQNNGKLTNIVFNQFTKSSNSLNEYIQKRVSYPVYNSLADIVGGLTAAVDDTWGNFVVVRNYSVNNKKFSWILHFTIYDHFGLDEPDVTAGQKPYVNLAGFRAWFVLQHYNKFASKYKPFVTIIGIDVPFEGELN